MADLRQTAVSPHTMQGGQAQAPRGLAATALDPLRRAYQAYQQYVGQPFQQAVRGGVRGYFGLPMMSDADALGREAYRQAEALGYTPGVGMPAGAVRLAAEGVQALPELATFIAAAAKTESPGFKNWFSGSKVVDEQGNPLVGYHYTTKNLDVFEPSDIGVHVGTTVGQAESRAKAHGSEGGNVMPLFMSIKNPLRLSDSPSWADPTWYVTESGIAKFLPKSLIDEAMGLREVYKKNQALERSIGRPGFANQENRKAAMEVNKKVREELQKQGYDGIVYANTHDGATLAEKMLAKDSYIAFQPEQIKSAIGNVGEYSAKSQKISD